MTSGFLWVLFLVVLLVVGAWLIVKAMSQRRADAQAQAAPVSVRSSGRITLRESPASLRRRFAIDPGDAGVADGTRGHGSVASPDAALDRYEELFRSFEDTRIAEDLAAVREMVENAFDQIDPMDTDALGLGRGGDGLFPDPTELETGAYGAGREGGEQGSDRPPTGFGLGGLASQDGRPNPMRGLRQSGYTAAQYHETVYPDQPPGPSSERTAYYPGRDANGTMVGRDHTNEEGEIVRSEFYERNNDGSSRTTVVNHQTGEKVQVTRDAEGNVHKRVQWQNGEDGMHYETESEISEDTAGNPGDAPTEGERQMAIWLWGRHRAGRGASSGPATVVFVNPPAPDEAGPTESGPLIWNYVELDLAGNPDPDDTSPTDRIPPEYRGRLLAYLREKTGGLVNPPGPDAPQ